MYSVTSKLSSYCGLESEKFENSAWGGGGGGTDTDGDHITGWEYYQTRENISETSLLAPHTHRRPVPSGKGTKWATGGSGRRWTLPLTGERTFRATCAAGRQRSTSGKETFRKRRCGGQGISSEPVLQGETSGASQAKSSQARWAATRDDQAAI